MLFGVLAGFWRQRWQNKKDQVDRRGEKNICALRNVATSQPYFLLCLIRLVLDILARDEPALAVFLWRRYPGEFIETLVWTEIVY